MQYHTLQNNSKKLLISDMEDDHLVNTIKAYLKKIRDAQAAMKKTYASDNIDLSIIGVDMDEVRERCQDTIGEYLEKLPSYVYELVIRGLIARVEDDIQKTHGRSEKTTLHEIYGGSKMKTSSLMEDDE